MSKGYGCGLVGLDVKARRKDWSRCRWHVGKGRWLVVVVVVVLATMALILSEGGNGNGRRLENNQNQVLTFHL